ncbi:MAG: adenylyl-sulfate kinase [Actinomycetota bacterium]|nr:adenylyl-sulfate kinase [Actinomycetota bacterium]
MSREERMGALGGRGATVWLTGLPGSGKSTLAAEMERRLVLGGRNAYRLDGDDLRTGLNGDLGFGRADREENIRRVGEVARLFADAGVVALVALISPYAEARARARLLHEHAGLPFVEVYLAVPVAVCAARDPKGHYARAMAGDLPSFTGVDDPYEVPSRPDVVVEATSSVGDAAALVMEVLDSRTGDGLAVGVDSRRGTASGTPEAGEPRT